MPRHYSTRSMVEQLSGLIDTDDLNDFERGFVVGMQRRLEEEALTQLTERQLNVLETIFSKHFA